MEWEYEYVFKTKWFRLAKLKLKFRKSGKNLFVFESSPKDFGYWDSKFFWRLK